MTPRSVTCFVVLFLLCVLASAFANWSTYEHTINAPEADSITRIGWPFAFFLNAPSEPGGLYAWSFDGFYLALDIVVIAVGSLVVSAGVSLFCFRSKDVV